MKGNIKNTEDGWVMVYKVWDDEKTYILPIHREEFNINKRFEGMVELKDGKMWDFDKIVIPNQQTLITEYWAKLKQPPYVSDDFTIGLNGAYEDNTE